MPLNIQRLSYQTRPGNNSNIHPQKANKMEAKDIKDIEAITGAKVVAATKENSSFNSDFVLLDDNGVIRQAFTVRDINGKMCIIPPMYESESISAALSFLNMTDEELAQNIDFINPETPTDNTPSTMNANETISAAIIAELNTRKNRSAWDKGVTEYATELAESLDNWDKQPESVAELREMMLNGADDWKTYSWGGSSLIYNQDIAERLCSPSELKRVTNKNGLRDYPNSREHWLDVQARALYQAANRVAAIASKFFNA